MKTAPKILMATITAALVAIGCATAQKWEYRTRTTHERIGKSVLDQYGRSGWELVNFTTIPASQSGTNYESATNVEFEYIFKRAKK